MVGGIDQKRRAEDIASRLEALGYERLDPAILQPAEIFLDLSGEDIRRRLLVAQDPEGNELCLRPDFTIPVACHHIEAGREATLARYCYAGPVFRFRPNGAASEFLQTGVELFGGDDRPAQDADIVALAAQELAREGVDAPFVRLGDKSVLSAFADALDLSPRWKRRLLLAFGDPGGPAGVLSGTGALAGTGAQRRAALLSGLAGADLTSARAMVEEMVAIAGIAPVGGRTPDEIAERLLEQAALTATDRLDDDKRTLLARVLSVSAPPEPARDELARIASGAGLDVAELLDTLTRRAEAIARLGVAAGAVTFEADFARRLDYYTGFVFEFYATGDAGEAPVVGGGRYDALLALLGAQRDVPAVGFSLWVERLPGGGQ
ncbi:MAG: ATP phosphoribosyltransferase regulatory subunit [Pseudomonadota bacterium]